MFLSLSLLFSCADKAHQHPQAENGNTVPKAPKFSMDAKKIIANPVYISLGKEKKSLNLQIIASMTAANGGMNFNGYSKGESAYYVPQGWKINALFINKSAAPHSAVIVREKMKKKLVVGAPFFNGAASSNAVAGSSQNKIEKFSFVAEKEGMYIVACGFPSHTISGQWVYFIVGPSSSQPKYVTDKSTLIAK